MPKLDPRYILNGAVLHTGGYTCQPTCAVMPDETWTCVMTYIADNWAEGSPGEHMVSMRSRDHGATWSELVAIEAYSNTSTKHVSAYGSVVARRDGSRVFALWVENVNDVQALPGSPPSSRFRADMLGEFVWKFSEDGGATWSAEHYRIPVPFNYIESVNSWSAAKGGDGKTQVMWQVDHVKQLSDGTALFAFTKIGTYAVAPPEEIFIMASRNLLSEAEPSKVTWEMWPEGEHGIGAVGAPDSSSVVAEEPHVMPILDETVFYIVFRTSQGYLGSAQSTPGNPKTKWMPSTFARYATSWADRFGANASWVKNCRGPISPKKQPNGLWLMTYYNTAPLGTFASHMTQNDRSNMWLTAGVEENGTVLWLQPELVLYDRRRDHGHGYTLPSGPRA